MILQAGIALGAVYHIFSSTNKSINLDEKARKRYAQAFAREQEAKRLLESKKQQADNAMVKVANRKRAIIITSMKNFVELYTTIIKIDFQEVKSLSKINNFSFCPQEIHAIKTAAQTAVSPMSDKEILKSVFCGGICGYMVKSSERDLKMANAQMRSAEVAYSQAENLGLILDSVTDCCNQVSDLLPKLNKIFIQGVKYSSKLIAEKGCNKSLYNEEDRKALCSCINIACAMKKIIDAPILNSDGSAAQETIVALQIGNGYLESLCKL
ncbi:MAG: hypothetical protein Q4E64_08095 [Phascolarctobacterium sp.]|uniref:hypothetical protein n=1 Tax=Phascolarctobacterium sp. TaxID=2049039 RepID=UPI0026DB5B91|nr:hypothetical protein [Phascolarctobacterium sp.]MDO4921770.1 hypothetical protein [Phascolarctobacterium sp.]